MLPNISKFIKRYVTKREKSFFDIDLINNKEKLTKEIKEKSVLVIGGAGTIGSSYIIAALKHNPSELIVVDTNENGLTELTRTLRSNPNINVPESYLTYPMSFNSDVFYKMLKKHGSFDIIANFAKNLCLGEKSTKKIQTGLEKKWKIKIDDYTSSLVAEKIKIPVLIIHDKIDGDVPVSSAYQIRQKLEKGSLLITNGLGHTKILRNKEVVNKSIDFIIKHK